MKKLFALLLAMLIACGTVVATSASTLHGDVNLDGDISIVDATDIQHYLASLSDLSDEELANADVDADGEVSVMDATCIKLYLADFIDKFPSEKQEQDLSLYKPCIDKARDEHFDSNGYVAGGYLCDIDNNGIEELIMVYTIADAKTNEREYFGDVYSIYTMKDNEVINLLDKEVLFMHAGAPSGEVYLMDNGMLGFLYKHIHHVDSETYIAQGDWDFYTINGTELESRHIEYTYYYSVSEKNILIDYERSYVIENGVETPYEDFENWFANINKECILMDSFNGKNVNTLVNLYDELI